MDRVFASGAAATPPSPPSSPSTGYPSKGNPSSGTAPTKPGDYWYYMITESLRKVITDSGLTPDHTNVNLVSLAIQNMIAAGGFKTPTRAATTANITTLAGGAPNTLDGVSLAVNDRVLVKDQTTAAQNGLYIVTTLGTGANGTWTRSTDADGAGELFAGMLVVVNEGTTNADSIWELSTDGAITIGTTAIAFSKKDGSGLVNQNNTWTKAQRGAFAALTSSGGSIAVDFSAANNYQHTLTENTTLATPSNLVAGQSGAIYLTQHASAAKTLAFSTFWKFSGGIVPALTTTLSAVDVLVYTVDPGGASATCQMIKDRR